MGWKFAGRCDRARIVPPVLFLTAKDTLDDRVDGLDAGADDLPGQTL